LALLIFGSVGFVAIAVATAILIANGRTGTTVGVTLPLVIVALVGHLMLIPSLGLFGAALVTTTVGMIGAVAAIIVVELSWKIKIPVATLLRGLLISAGAYLVASVWPASGLASVSLKLLVLGALVPAAFFVLGEFDASERRAIFAAFRRTSIFPQHAPL
jgi:O-antigen/teichoic acid export membrane protein